MRAPLPPTPEAIEAIRVGQIYVDRRRNPESAFVVQTLGARKYADGNTATRVSGLLIAGEDDMHDRELDARSLLQMFPVLKFDPPKAHDPDENK